jgi:hypothetical protein
MFALMRRRAGVTASHLPTGANRLLPGRTVEPLIGAYGVLVAVAGVLVVVVPGTTVLVLVAIAGVPVVVVLGTAVLVPVPVTGVVVVVVLGTAVLVPVPATGVVVPLATAVAVGLPVAVVDGPIAMAKMWISAMSAVAVGSVMLAAVLEGFRASDVKKT